MAEALPRPWTIEDFLAWEAQQDERYEFIDGVIVAMTGGSIAHATIIGNVYHALRTRLVGGPCRPLVDGPRLVIARPPRRRTVLHDPHVALPRPPTSASLSPQVLARRRQCSRMTLAVRGRAGGARPSRPMLNGEGSS